MGKQYNKQIKRRRRTAYLARRKASMQAGQEKSSPKKTSKATTAKAPRKKTAAKAKPEEPKEEVAAKAQPDDVLGPESGGEEATEESAES